MKPRALVTGASRGIGAAIARRLASDGHPVIVNYRRDAQAAAAVCDEIIATGGVAEARQFDVADAQTTAAAIARLLGEQPGIGIVVNNAGVTADALLPMLDRDAWDRVLRTTLDGFYNVTRPLVMPMVRARFGRIINISSVSAVLGNRGQTNYAAAKAGLIGATKSLAREVARRGVTVNAVAPGLIETEMVEGLPLDELRKTIPAGRLGRPEEVAAVVSFLASAESSYVTGQVIGVNGGVV